MNALQLIFLGLLFFTTIFMVFRLGFEYGKLKQRKASQKTHIQAMRDSMDAWMEAQEEAGVTPEQKLKINEVLARKIMEEFKGVMKEF